MRADDKERIYVNTRTRYWGIRFRSGIKNIRHSKLHIIGFIAFVVLLFCLTKEQCYNLINIALKDSHSAEFYFIWFGAITLFYIVVISFAVILLGTPKEYLRFRNELLRIGLTNSAGECPILISTYKDAKYPQATVYEFLGLGIPLKEWEDKKAKIEASLNAYVVKITEGKNKHTMLLYAVSADNKLPSHIKWNDNYMIQDSSTLVLGRNHMGDITVNLAKIPHILLGGSTGSGKSVLLKLLLMQAIKKGIVVTIADFKGGVDFPQIWHEKTNICTDEEELLQILTALADTLQSRKIILKESGCANIDEYNIKTGNNLPRYIFACDEIAEVLDKTGLTKEQKDLVTKIESKLSIIARQGRAFGIHLILATQRPDANILSGQIRNNIDCRACGRADQVLSQIILDSPIAAEQIPKDAAGRFILHDGTLFQAYIFDDSKF